ncbi:SDR family oxidoreductase [Rhizobium sp. PAMB 3182]
MTETLLVTGASGKLGKAVLNNLLEADHPAGKIIATTRDITKLSDFAEKGVVVRAATFDEPTSLRAAFAGADRLLLISTDELIAPGKRLAQHKNAVEAATAAGLKHIVYTSMPKPEPGNPVLFAPDHYGTEQAIIASGMGYTILRNTWYQENLFLVLPDAFKSGTLYTSAGDGRISHIAHADCAKAAAAALAPTTSENRILTLTGPELFTTAEIAALATSVVGKPLSVVNLTDEQLIAGMVAHGLPEPVAKIFASFDTNTRQGGFDILTDDFEMLTGKKPRPLKAFFEQVKSQF